MGGCMLVSVAADVSWDKTKQRIGWYRIILSSVKKLYWFLYSCYEFPLSTSCAVDWSTNRPPVKKIIPRHSRRTAQALSHVSNMANSRKFADKIAWHKQNQEDGTRAFEQVMNKPVTILEVTEFFLIGEFIFLVLYVLRCWYAPVA